MAQHITQAAIQTLLGATVSNLHPFELYQLVDAMNRIKHVEGGDGLTGAGGAGESTLGTIFASTNPNP